MTISPASIRRRRLLVVGVVVGVLLAAFGAGRAWWSNRGEVPQPDPRPSQIEVKGPGVHPDEQFPEEWDTALDEDQYLDNAAPKLRSLGMGEVEARAAVTAGVEALSRSLAGDEWMRPPGDLPNVKAGSDAALRCPRAPKVFDSAAANLEVADAKNPWAQVVVLWDTSGCTQGGVPFESGGATQVSVMYVTEYEGRWTAVRASQVPGTATGWRPAGPAEPAAWTVERLPLCGPESNSTYAAVAEVTAAWGALCQAAEAEGVALDVTSALWTREGYEARWKAYDTAGKLETWSGWTPSGDCASLHCAGVAIAVEPSREAVAWLSATVQCITQGQVVEPVDGGCPNGVAVSRAATFGFAQPQPQAPWELEWALPTSATIRGRTDCDPSAGTPRGELVAAVFRCELGALGLPAESVERAALEAAIVSQCISGWNPRFDQQGVGEQAGAGDRRGLFGEPRGVAGDRFGDLFSPTEAARSAANTWYDTRSEPWSFVEEGCRPGSLPAWTKSL